MMLTSEQAKVRFQHLMKVRSWPEWPAVLEKLHELGCTEEQCRQIRQGVEEVVLHGTYGTADYDLASFVHQVLSVLLHQGYTVFTNLEQPGDKPVMKQSTLNRSEWLVYVGQDTGYEECPRCHGTKVEILGSGKEPCHECGGRGVISNKHHQRLWNQVGQPTDTIEPGQALDFRYAGADPLAGLNANWVAEENGVTARISFYPEADQPYHYEATRGDVSLGSDWVMTYKAAVAACSRLAH